ncbi:MAG: DNA polymerase III subunit beta [Gammaproteobacteria bacterium]|nr:DNA polymerase III subunit beta [Gammaproteobacteria bacterium]NNC96438.1 DNA polymerase III subunit beta [Gammaproteobacteria bacterium]NNM13453.1 DNA polymerase III subunit beta [Gammaproteobacteria bacterium]
MLFTISRDSFLKTLQAVIGVVERRQTMPVLANVFVQVSKNDLSLTATDLEVQLAASTSDGLKVEKAGDITLPGRKLLDICRNLPAGSDLRFALDKERVTVRSGRSRFTLSTLPATEFPVLEAVKGAQTIKISQNTLREQIERTQFSMAQQDVRYYLNGMLFELKDGNLVTVATDGHRLAMAATAVEHKSDVQIILPRKGVLELSRLLETDGDVEITLSQHHLQAELGDRRFISKLIDGKFPEYQRVIPNSTSNNIAADRQELRAALQRAAILSNEKFRGIRLELKENTLGIHSHNPEQEEAEDAIEIQFGGESFEVGFNVNYLLDVLGILQSDQIELGLTDSNSSCLITDEKMPGAKFVIMPMRL